MPNTMQKHYIETMLDEYDPNNVLGQPTITWANYRNLGLLIDLMKKVEKLEAEVQQLRANSSQ